MIELTQQHLYAVIWSRLLFSTQSEVISYPNSNCFPLPFNGTGFPFTLY